MVASMRLSRWRALVAIAIEPWVPGFRESFHLAQALMNVVVIQRPHHHLEDASGGTDPSRGGLLWILHNRHQHMRCRRRRVEQGMNRPADQFPACPAILRLELRELQPAS